MGDNIHICKIFLRILPFQIAKTNPMVQPNFSCHRSNYMERGIRYRTCQQRQIIQYYIQVCVNDRMYKTDTSHVDMDMGHQFISRCGNRNYCVFVLLRLLVVK